MRVLPLHVAASALLVQAAVAQSPVPLPPPPSAQAPAPSPAPPGDTVLEGLIRDALASNPELAGAEDRVTAEKERVPQAGSLPDPQLFLGYQNDGFDKLQYGRMETTWATVMATQSFPYPGKRRLRTEVARQSVNAAQAGLERVRLTLEADVRRAYTALLLTRGRLALLDEQASLWEKAEAIARIRYETGEGTQADLLRSQLERTRLKQDRTVLQTDGRNRVTELNRLASRTLESPIEISVSLEQLPDPQLPAAPMDESERRSPEISEARHHIRHFQSQVDLARLETRPDFTLSAGVMPRGALPPMWQVGFSVSLPIYAGTKQKRAVAESEALARSSQQSVENLRRLLAERTQERLDQMAAAREVLHIYREGLLTQSEATVRSTISQYEVGRTTFTSVLDALNGYVADRGKFLEAIAQAQNIDIANREVSLSPTPGLSGGASMGSASMAGSGSPSAAPSSAGAKTPSASSSNTTASMGQM